MNQQDGPVPVSRRNFLGAAAGAAAIAGGTGAASAAEQEGGATVTVDVVDFAFEPGTSEPLEIPPGTTVKWVWQGDSHNIHVDSQPDGANWEGHEPIENTGFEYEYTFEVEGDYHYWCVPHEGMGMIADLVVSADAPVPGQEPASGHVSILPDSAKTLGVASVGGMASVLGLSYVFLRFGGEYDDDE